METALRQFGSLRKLDSAVLFNETKWRTFVVEDEIIHNNIFDVIQSL